MQFDDVLIHKLANVEIISNLIMESKTMFVILPFIFNEVLLQHI